MRGCVCVCMREETCPDRVDHMSQVLQSHRKHIAAPAPIGEDRSVADGSEADVRRLSFCVCAGPRPSHIRLSRLRKEQEVPSPEERG